MSDLYNSFYGFTKPPFNITPDPQFLFFSDRHREALNHLMFGITQRKGFIMLTGEVGSGKTTLCRAMLEQLDNDKFSTAIILNPRITEVQLLQSIIAEFGLTSPKQNRLAYTQTLNEFLLNEVNANRDSVLIIDESQDMSMALLEQVRLLSNLETDQRKLLQIVLIGQPELRNKIDNARMRQLRQRITVRYHLEPLSREEVGKYIQHRLQTSGCNGRLNFSPWAIHNIYRYSGGVPRLVNAVCDKALLCGYVNGTENLRRKHIIRAIRELEGKAA